VSGERDVLVPLTDEEAADLEAALQCAAGEYGGERELALAYRIRLCRDEARHRSD
jgi:hypothetical protein